jgi:hypothetical protein
VPGTFAVALNCVALKGVPYVIAGGGPQVTTGVAFAIVQEVAPLVPV